MNRKDIGLKHRRNNMKIFILYLNEALTQTEQIKMEKGEKEFNVSIFRFADAEN